MSNRMLAALLAGHQLKKSCFFFIIDPFVSINGAVLCWNHIYTLYRCYSDTNRLMFYNIKRIIYVNLLHQEMVSKIYISSCFISISDAIVHACEVPGHTCIYTCT